MVKSVNKIFGWVLLVLIIPLGFLLIGGLLGWKVPHGGVDSAQKSPYECGFAPFQSGRRPFSVFFFLLALLFLLFDVELILLSPLPLLGGVSSGFWGIFLFLVVLVVGLLHEWREGSLEWSSETVP